MTNTAINFSLPGFDSEVVLTTEHSASSYGIPVLLIAGQPFGLDDVSPAGDRIRIMLNDWCYWANDGSGKVSTDAQNAVRSWIGEPAL